MSFTGSLATGSVRFWYNTWHDLPELGGGSEQGLLNMNVQYAYSFTTSGSMNHSRLTSITYPNGRVITYNYASGLSDTITPLFPSAAARTPALPTASASFQSCFDTR